MSAELVFSLLVFCFFLVMIFSTIPMWSASAQVYGRFPAAEAKLMLYFRFTSIYTYMMYFPLLGAILVTTTNVIGASSIPWIGVLGLLLFQAYIAIVQACPPTVVFLSSSNSESALLRYRLERGIHPYRVVALLDAAVERDSSSFYQNSLEWDNFWTKGPWEPVVITLIGRAPRIVIDARIASPSVITETKIVCADSTLLSKTVFVVNQDGSAPTLSDAGIQVPASGFRLLQEEHLISALRSSGLPLVASPDDHPWIKRLHGDSR